MFVFVCVVGRRPKLKSATCEEGARAFAEEGATQKHM